MPIPERLTREEIKQKVLGIPYYDMMKNNGVVSFHESEIDKLMIEAYNQGTLCQHSSHGNRVGHFEEWNK